MKIKGVTQRFSNHFEVEHCESKYIFSSYILCYFKVLYQMLIKNFYHLLYIRWLVWYEKTSFVTNKDSEAMLFSFNLHWIIS